MSLENLEKSIRKNAQKEADWILSEAEKEADVIRKEARARIAARKKELQKNLERETLLLASRKRARARMLKNQALLEEKKKLITEVYDRFLAKMEKNKRDIMKKMFMKAKNELSIGKVYVKSEDLKVAKAALPEIPIEKRSILGGIIAESKDGTELVDYSYETILEILRQRTLKQVSSELFGGKK